MHSHECNGYKHSPNCSKYADGTRGIVYTVIRFKFNCFFRHRTCYANIVRMNCARNITIQLYDTHDRIDPGVNGFTLAPFFVCGQVRWCQRESTQHAQRRERFAGHNNRRCGALVNRWAHGTLCVRLPRLPAQCPGASSRACRRRRIRCWSGGTVGGMQRGIQSSSAGIPHCGWLAPGVGARRADQRHAWWQDRQT